MKHLCIYLLVSFTVLLTACGGSSSSTSVAPEDRVGSLPLNILEPADNPSNPAKVALGKLLFWDPIMSGSKDVACVTCHHPDNGYAEHIDLSVGVGGQGLSNGRKFGTQVKRNAPTIINTAFNGIDSNLFYDPSNTVMFWDNRSHSLEDQALGPIRSEEEMRGVDIPEDQIVTIVATRLQAIQEYQDLFTSAFGDNTINGDRIAKAIASFERSLSAMNSPFDRYARGDKNAMSREEVRGMNAFMEAGCQACHSGPMFSDFKLHQLPVAHNNKLSEQDTGVNGKFRTGSLRNIALTAPYMHNGTRPDLESAVRFYHGIGNPSNDPELSALDLNNEQANIDAIVAFLRALTDDSFDKTIPASVPSGLNPGGDI